MSWQDVYLGTSGQWGNAFGARGSLYAAGHRGTDIRVDPNGSGALPAWERLECVNMGFHDAVGHYVNLRALSDGLFFGAAHVKQGTRPDVGQVLEPGDRIALPALVKDDEPGWAWTGPHYHIVGSHIADAAQGFLNGALFDARPRIIAAARGGSLAGSGAGKLLLEDTTGKVDEMYSFIRYFDNPGDFHLMSHLTGEHVKVPTLAHRNMIRRALGGDPQELDPEKVPQMNAAELSIARGYIRAVNPPVGVRIDGDALADAFQSIDLDALSVGEVEDAVTRALTRFAQKAIA